MDESTAAALKASLKASHMRIWKAYRVDAFPDSAQFFQFVGSKGAARHGCNATDLRGVVSLAPWHRDTQQIRDLGLLAKWQAAAAR